MIVIGNDRVAISFSDVTGAVTGLEDKARGVRWIDGSDAVPFRIDNGLDFSSTFESFTAEKDASFTAGTAYRLRWVIGGGLVLQARVEVRAGSDEISFTSQLDNSGDSFVHNVEYPILGGIRSLGAGDTLAHSYATGLLVRNPLRNFSFDGDGLRFMPWPESFSGASMQFFAYYSKGKGGLYFAAYDSSYSPKWLNFYRMSGALEASQMYGDEDIGARKGADAPWPFVVKMFPGDDWYEAADIYKAWAIQQPWCSQGTLVQRGDQDTAAWLLKNVGASTFGIDASYDRTLWIRRYHQDIGAPIFHILGPDWPRVDQNYYNSVSGGMADWFPTRFSRANLDLIRQQGDYFAPFEFDYLVDPRKSDGPLLRANLQVFPPKPRSFDAYAFTMLDPTTEFTRNLHVQRDVRVYDEARVDSMYYDISANNLIKADLSPDHGHPVGGGRELTLGYKRNYAETRAALTARAGHYVPLGTEMMNEVFLPELDYYQARAWALPSSAFEMSGRFRDLIKSGQAEVIPLFTYVYHEYGALRLDGWGKLVKETGDLFYNIAAKTYLWGGIYEINHEYSPMEAINGVENSPAEHYFKFDPQGFAYDPGRAQYIGQLASLRTGPGNRYLAYGTMLRPPEIAPSNTPMSWFHYNSNQGWREYRDRGTIVVPGIVESAWKQGEGSGTSYAFFFANTEGKEATVSGKISRDRYGMTGTGWRMRVLTGFAKDHTFTTARDDAIDTGADVTLSLLLGSRDLAMVEFYRK